LHLIIIRNKFYQNLFSGDLSLCFFGKNFIKNLKGGVMKILLSFLLILASSNFSQQPEWKLEGKALTVDNCAIGCPCILGEPPTHGRCQYSGILLIEKGNYGDVNLDNTKLALGGAFGRSKEMGEQEYDFAAFYIDASLSEKQKDAIKKILASPQFEGFGKPEEIKEVAIIVNGADNFGKVGKTYGGTIGDFAKIEITPVHGFMSDEPIVIENSAEPMFYWTALGKSSNSYFKGAGQNWSFNATSGESHRFYISSSGDKPKGHH
jgi:hypothetical protein